MTANGKSVGISFVTKNRIVLLTSSLTACEFLINNNSKATTASGFSKLKKKFCNSFRFGLDILSVIFYTRFHIVY